MHYLQKYILDRLRFEQPLSYSQMLPKHIESSQFMYHLRTLVKKGLIQKESRGIYTLSHAGQAALEYLSVGRVNPVRMPKVVTHTLLTHQGQLLLLRKQKEPYRHLIEPVAGKIHFGESAEDAAQREVREKLGLEIPKPRLAGVADIIIAKQQKPLTHMTTYVHRHELDALPSPLPENIVIGTLESLPKDQFVPVTIPLIQVTLAATGLFVIKLHVSADV